MDRLDPAPEKGPAIVTDAIDEAADLAPGDALHALRRRRPDFVAGAEACRAAVLHPASEHGLPQALRAALALRMAVLNKDEALVAAYAALLDELGPEPAVAALGRGEGDLPEPLAAIARHADLVTAAPASASEADIRRLEAAGLTNPQIVALSELIAFVNFQTRIVAGLRLMRSA